MDILEICMGLGSVWTVFEKFTLSLFFQHVSNKQYVLVTSTFLKPGG
jgi:hypothetical protein